MSERIHFWLRIASLAAILAAEFAPRLWSPAPSAASAGAHAVSHDAAIAVQQAVAAGQ